MSELHDFIVLGSGCAGSQAAETLLEAGAKVAMLDVGETGDAASRAPEGKSFVELRKTDPDQHRYFLGQGFEALQFEGGAAGHMAPSRSFVSRRVRELTPLLSKTFHPMESLALGGLGASWGLGCQVFSDAEIEATGADPARMREAYETVSRRIGISAQKDDAAAYTLGELAHHQKSLPIDANMDLILRRYALKREELQARGFFLGRLPLALLSENLGERRAYDGSEMEFWSDSGKSAYRPWMTVEALRQKYHQFAYHGGELALRFEERDGIVQVATKPVHGGEERVHRCRKLLLTAGVFATARIVLRSFPDQGQRLTFASNPFCYIPTLNWSHLGGAVEDRRSASGQLVMFFDPAKNNLNASMSVFFSHRSLLLWRLLKQAPIDYMSARRILQLVQSCFTIVTFNAADKPTSRKFVERAADSASPTGDALKAEYELSGTELGAVRSARWAVMAALWKMGCVPLGHTALVPGASIHYGGTLPYSTDDRPFTTARDGRLHGTKNIFVGDASSFRCLPAKGVTFSLMAHAHLVASQLASRSN